MAKKLLYPELVKNIRVQYKDRNEATRGGRIRARHGNTVSIELAVGRNERVSIERVIGFWQPKVKASPKNFIKLKK